MAVLPNLPLLQERFKNAISGELKQYGIDDPNFEVQTMFLQYYELTATGFGFDLGHMTTNDYTTIFENIDLGYAAVFFGEKLAHIIKNPNDVFSEDVRNRKMCMIGFHRKYEKEGKEGESH